MTSPRNRIFKRTLSLSRSSKTKGLGIGLELRKCRLGFFLLLVPCLVASSISGRAQAPTKETREQLDLTTLSKIREEGLNHSQVMRYAEELADSIGPRLTGSPEFDRAVVWAVQQLQASGIENARQESWGEFGMAWTQIGTTLLLTSPTAATLIAQATPWSPATNGEISAGLILMPKITTEAELNEFKGKLKGKIVLYGLPPATDLQPKAPMEPINDEYFRIRMNYPLEGRPSGSIEFDQKAAKSHALAEKVATFLVSEGALAVLCSPSGDANTFRNDGSPIAWHNFQLEHKQPIPSAVVAPDSYGRLARLTLRHAPVKVQLNIQTSFGAEHVDGRNVLGEIRGSDPRLTDQVVMLGAHLDSWASATGATDDGAGVVIELEALRILKAIGAAPRRTVRVALWGGEEEGEIGSMRYLEKHFVSVDRPSSGPWATVPDWDKPALAVTPRPEFNKLDAYFNLDAGGGRIYGIYSNNDVGAAAVFRQWIEPIQDLGFDKISLLWRDGIDANRFDEVGLPAFPLMQDLRDYNTRTHHTNLDTFEKLSEPDLKQAATVMAIVIFNAAQRDDMIARNPMISAVNR